MEFFSPGNIFPQRCCQCGKVLNYSYNKEANSIHFEARRKWDSPWMGLPKDQVSISSKWFNIFGQGSNSKIQPWNFFFFSLIQNCLDGVIIFWYWYLEFFFVCSDPSQVVRCHFWLGLKVFGRIQNILILGSTNLFLTIKHSNSLIKKRKKTLYVVDFRRILSLFKS